MAVFVGWRVGAYVFSAGWGISFRTIQMKQVLCMHFLINFHSSFSLVSISWSFVASLHGSGKIHSTFHHKPLLICARFRSLFISRLGSFLLSALLCLFLNRNSCFSSKDISTGHQHPGNETIPPVRWHFVKSRLHCTFVKWH